MNNWLRRYGAVIALCALAVAVAVYGVYANRDSRAPDAVVETAVQGQPEEPGVIVQPPPPEPPDARRRDAEFERTHALLEEYEQRVSAQPGAEETPALLMAMGNLCRQRLMDYARAAHYYRRLISEFPDDPNIPTAYVQLGVCYEQLDDDRALRLHYNEMMRRFPEDSQEFLFAQQQLSAL